MSNFPPPPPSPPPGAPFGAPGSPPPPGYQAYSNYGTAPQNYAGFGSRLGAYLIDGLIAALFAAPAFVALLAGPSHVGTCTVNDEVSLCNIPDGGTIAITVALGLVAVVTFLWLYCRRVGLRGQSWGMQAVGNKVVDGTTGQTIGVGRAVGRFFGRIVSGWACYLGFLWMLWDSRKQTWHDKMVNSIVVKA